MENKTKTNDQLSPDYYEVITNTHKAKCLYEAKRILNKFKAFVGQFPPTTDLAVQFIGQFQEIKERLQEFSDIERLPGYCQLC